MSLWNVCPVETERGGGRTQSHQRRGAGGETEEPG